MKKETKLIYESKLHSLTIQTRIYDKDLCDIIKDKKGLSDD